mgnify:CR=1 FL=1
MAYALGGVTLRTNNTEDGMKKINEVWRDVESGKIPILFDSEHNFIKGVSPVSLYSDYASDETGDYNLTVLGVTADFFKELEEMTAAGEFKKYDVSSDNGDLAECAQKAWSAVWADSKEGKIKRKFDRDYESTVPAEYTKDKKAHCYLYISVK